MISVERADKFTTVIQEAEYVTELDYSLGNWPAFGKIRFENAAMRYRPNTPLVIKDFSIEI